MRQIGYLPQDEVKVRLALVGHVIAVDALRERNQLVLTLHEQQLEYGKRMHVLVAGQLLVRRVRLAVDAYVAVFGAYGQQAQLFVIVHGRRFGRETLVGDFVERKEVLLYLTSSPRRRIGHRGRVVCSERITRV